MNLGDVLDTGRQRRGKLDNSIAETLRYYLGPTGIPERIGALGEILNPVRGMEDASISAQTMANPELSMWDRVAAGGRMATEVAGAAAPLAVGRLGGSTDDAARAIQEALTGMSAAPSAVAGRDFLADEAGAIRAWHGSPHDFDKFSMDKIGTGEGAQAYGHGLYFAENADTARNYKTALSPGMGKDALRAEGISETHIRALDQFTKSGVDKDVAYRDWLNWTGLRDHPAMKRAFDSDWAGRNDGRLYEVEIDANPEDFLDWDAPLSEQPKALQDVVRKADLSHLPAGGRLRRTIEAWRKNPGDWQPEPGANIPEPTGNQIHSALTDYGTSAPENAALTSSMREAGIPGIRYLDQGSRGAGDGTRNYVVFDDSLISIIKKYGIAGAAAMLGMSAEDLQAQAAQQGAPLKDYLK